MKYAVPCKCALQKRISAYCKYLFIISKFSIEMEHRASVDAYKGVNTPNEKSNEPSRVSNVQVMERKQTFMEKATGPLGVIAGVIIGGVVGIVLAQVGASDELISWIKVPGDLFIRALKCLVSPLVFCSLVCGMAEMLSVGKASAIGWRAALLYTTTTVIASAQGLIWVLSFRSQFSSMDGEEVKQEFEKLTLSESLQEQLKVIVTDNITNSFANASLLSIVMFALPFGVVVAKLPKSVDGVNRVLELFQNLNKAFMHMIRWAIAVTPIAVLFLIAGELATRDDLWKLIKEVGLLLGCVFVGLIGHVLVVLPGILALVIRKNPFAYLKHIIPAQIFALGCASSMATLPVTIKCVDATRQVSKSLSRFVLSLGATINMDGSALYYPAAIVFMAETAGLGDQIGAVEMFLIVLVSTVGAVGSAPVPSAGIVMTITIWNSVFPHIPLPSTFSFILATDWLTDRFITATNVTGDSVIARVIAEMVGETTFVDEIEDVESASPVQNM